jgi:hypothetical protein
MRRNPIFLDSLKLQDKKTLADAVMAYQRKEITMVDLQDVYCSVPGGLEWFMSLFDCAGGC